MICFRNNLCFEVDLNIDSNPMEKFKTQSQCLPVSRENIGSQNAVLQHLIDSECSKKKRPELELLKRFPDIILN